MGQGEKDGAVPASATAETDIIDASWDDDADIESGVSAVQPDRDELDDATNRVTVVPDEPAEAWAKRLLAEAPQSSPPTAERAPSAPPFHDRETPTRPGDVEKTPRPPSLELPFSASPTPRPAKQVRPPSVDDLDLSPGRGSLPELELDLDHRPAELPEPPPSTKPQPLQEPHSEQGDPAVTDMKDRYATGDFTGALIIAESLLESDPNDEEALRYAESCRDVLMQMYAARLGSLEQVATVAIPPDQIRWLTLDHRAGFLLSMMDGASTLEEVLDVCGMPRLDAMRILFTLLEQRVIRLQSQ